MKDNGSDELTNVCRILEISSHVHFQNVPASTGSETSAFGMSVSGSDSVMRSEAVFEKLYRELKFAECVTYVLGSAHFLLSQPFHWFSCTICSFLSGYNRALFPFFHNKAQPVIGETTLSPEKT